LFIKIAELTLNPKTSDAIQHTAQRRAGSFAFLDKFRFPSLKVPFLDIGK
jgi:hypothetical protein